MSTDPYQETVRVALHASGWQTNWSPTRKGPNEAGWFVQRDPDFRTRRHVRVRVFPPHARLIIVGDDTGAYVFAYSFLRALQEKQAQADGDTPTPTEYIDIPLKTAAKFAIFTLSFKVTRE